MKTRKKTISASEFKAKCLKILDELGAEGIIIEKRGKPIAKVIPVGPADNSKLIGSMRGMIKVKGTTSSTELNGEVKSCTQLFDCLFGGRSYDSRAFHGCKRNLAII